MALAFLLKALGDDESFLLIQVAVQSAAFALDGFSKLPQGMGAVCLMLLGVWGVYAGAGQELVEQFLVCPFVDGLVALAALEIPSCLLKLVLIWCDRMFLLGFQQRCNPAGSGGFLSNCFARREIRFWGRCCQLGAFLLKAFLNEGCWEPLVDPGLAGVALVPTPVGLPLVFAELPWLLALVAAVAVAVAEAVAAAVAAVAAAVAAVAVAAAVVAVAVAAVQQQ